MSKFNVVFTDMEEERDPIEINVGMEEVPPTGSWFKVSGAGLRRAHRVVRHYGKKGLLRIEVQYTRLSLHEMQRSTVAKRVRETG